MLKIKSIQEICLGEIRMEFQTLEELVIKLPIYTPVEISFSNGESTITKDGQNMLKILFNNSKINLYCVDCKREYPFTVKYEIKKRIFKEDIYHYKNALENYVSCSIDNAVLRVGESFSPKKDEGIVEYLFVCGMESKHYYTMTLHYYLSDGKFVLIKTGQYPITRDLKECYSKKYQKILNKYNALDDFKKFEQSQERGLLAGSCTYLRRIFEKMVFFMIEEAKNEGVDVNEAKHFDDKIKLVKYKFDPEITAVLEESYDLLSKGIHQLTDEQIDEFDGLMQEVILLQLDFEKTNNERKETINNLRNNIHSVHQKNNK